MEVLDKQLFQQILRFGNYRWIKLPEGISDGDYLQFVDGEFVGASIDLSGYIPKPSTANDGDVLLFDQASNAWLAATVTLPYQSTFSAYNDTTVVNITNTDIYYDTEAIKDSSIYTHTTGAAGVTVAETGAYYIQIDGGFQVSGGATAVINSYLKVNGTQIQGFRAISQLPTNASGSHSIGRIVNLNAGDVVKHYVEGTSVGTISTLADMCRMTITTEFGGSIDVVTPGTTGSPIGLLLALTYPT